MISLIAIGLSMATIAGSGASALNLSDGMLSNPQHTISATTTVLKVQRVLNKKSKRLSYLAPNGDRFQLNFDFYYDAVTNQLLEAYFVGGNGFAANGTGFNIPVTEQEGVVTGDCAQFSIFFTYNVNSTTKSLFYEPTVCMSF